MVKEGIDINWDFVMEEVDGGVFISALSIALAYHFVFHSFLWEDYEEGAILNGRSQKVVDTFRSRCRGVLDQTKVARGLVDRTGVIDQVKKRCEPSTGTRCRLYVDSLFFFDELDTGLAIVELINAMDAFRAFTRYVTFVYENDVLSQGWGEEEHSIFKSNLDVVMDRSKEAFSYLDDPKLLYGESTETPFGREYDF